MNRIVITALIIGVIAIAAIGAGYAYAAYTANSDNSTELNYLIITPSDGEDPVYSGSFTKDVELDTQTVLTNKGALAEPRYVQEVIYSLADGTYETIGGHEYVSVGELYLTVNETKSSDDYTLSVIIEDGTGLNTDDFSYYAMFRIGSGEDLEDSIDAAEAAAGSMVQMVEDSGDFIAESSEITNDEDNSYTVAIVNIYVGMNGGDSITRPLADLIDSEVLDDVTFMFKASTE